MGGSGQDSNSIAPEMNDSGQLCQKIATNANDTKNEIDNSEGDFSSRTRGILAMTAETTSELNEKWPKLREVRDSSSCDPQYLEKKSADNKMAMEKDALESTTFSQNEVETEIKSYKSPPTDVDALKKKYETDFQEVCTKMAAFLNSQSVLVSEIDLFEDIKPVLATICGLKEHDDKTTGNLLKLFQDILSKVKEAPFDAARNYEDITNSIKEGPESIEGFCELKIQHEKENDYGALQETEKLLLEAIASTCNNTLVETQRIEKSHSILCECSDTVKAQQDTFVNDEIAKLEDQVEKLEADDKLLKDKLVHHETELNKGKTANETLKSGVDRLEQRVNQEHNEFMNGTGTNLGLRPFFERMIKNDIQLNEEKLKLFTAEALQEREEASFKEIKTKSEKHQALITELLVILKDRIKLLQTVMYAPVNFIKHLSKILENFLTAPLPSIEANAAHLTRMRQLLKEVIEYGINHHCKTELNRLYLNKYMNAAKKLKMDMDRKNAYRCTGKDVLADEAKALESIIATTDEQLKTREKELEDFIEKYDYVKNNEALKAKSIVATKKEQAMEMARNEYNSMQQQMVDVMDKTRNMPAIAGVF